MKVAFVSTMESVPWGASEELWSQTAIRMASQKHQVLASVRRWPTSPTGIRNILSTGAKVYFRQYSQRLNSIMNQRLLHSQISRFLSEKPNICVISNGYHTQGLEWMEACASKNIPYIVLVHLVGEHDWPVDEWACRLAVAYSSAAVVCFVSKGNQQLLESQFGASLQNAVLIRNPIKECCRTSQPWALDHEHVQIACPGRLQPAAKGQDLLLQVMARPHWRKRSVTVNFYGDGPNRSSLQRLSSHLKLHNVHFHGHIEHITEAWKSNHLIVIPSRFEGVPLVAVEAMLAARPVVVTNVADTTTLIEDNRTGFIAAGATVDALDEAVSRAWTKRKDWPIIGHRASERITQMYTTDGVENLTEYIMQFASKN